MIRDIGLFVQSVINSRLYNGNGFYWDGANSEELSKLVDILSNTEDEERKEIRRILRELNPKSILDAGCGPATELKGYREHGIDLNYVGLDWSFYMLGMARERFPDTVFIRGDVEDMHFNNNDFQAVLLKHILEHLQDYKTAVQESVRVAEDFVIIDFFHRLLPFNIDVHLNDRRGFWNNWYSRSRFEEFLDGLHISHYDRIVTKGTASQTAEIYVLHKKPAH